MPGIKLSPNFRIGTGTHELLGFFALLLFFGFFLFVGVVNKLESVSDALHNRVFVLGIFVFVIFGIFIDSADQSRELDRGGYVFSLLHLFCKLQIYVTLPRLHAVDHWLNRLGMNPGLLFFMDIHQARRSLDEIISLFLGSRSCQQ